MTIDPSILAFIHDTEAFYPADAASRPVPEQRRLYDAYARAFAVPRPPGIESEDAVLTTSADAIPLRLYRPAGPPAGTLLYAHGGGFMLGSLDSHDGVAARIAADTGAAVVAIDYRLAPEHPYPAALDDVLAVVEAAAGRSLPWPVPAAPLLLAGDSAGGTLMAAAALRLARNVPLAGLALVYPALGWEPAEPARTTEAEAPMLTLADVHFYRDLFFAGRTPDPGLMPLGVEGAALAGLPPTYLLLAEHDPLRDDGTVFAERLRGAGVPVTLDPGRGLVHGWLRAIARCGVAAQAFEGLVGFIASRLNAESPRVANRGARVAADHVGFLTAP